MALLHHNIYTEYKHRSELLINTDFLNLQVSMFYFNNNLPYYILNKLLKHRNV